MRCKRFLRKQVKFSRFVLAPVRVLLCSARHLYANTFCRCAEVIGEGSAVMAGIVLLPQVYPMHGKNNSSSSSTKKKRSIQSSTELIRVITTRNPKGTISGTNCNGRGKSSAASESGSCLRSYSVRLGQIGRIDEDVPCDFVKTNGSIKSIMHQRGKSSAFH